MAEKALVLDDRPMSERRLRKLKLKADQIARRSPDAIRYDLCDADVGSIVVAAINALRAVRALRRLPHKRAGR